MDQSSSGIRRIIVLVILIAALYGASYQQFRYFRSATPGGSSDSGSYLPMCIGRYASDQGVSDYHRYRFVTPVIAGFVRELLPANPVNSDEPYLYEILAYFIVNFSFNIIAAYTLFEILKTFGMSDLLSLIGALLYIASRITVMTTATPIVDAVVFAAVGSLVLLIQNQRSLWLALAMPILVLAKETMLPLLFLPLMTAHRRAWYVWLSIPISVVAYFAAQAAWAHYIGIPKNLAGDTISFIQETLLSNFQRLFSPGGLYDLACGFTLLLPLAVWGCWQHRKQPNFQIPLYLFCFLPIGLGYAVLNGNLGRMFQFAFPLIIPYCCVAIDNILGNTEKKTSYS